MMKYGVLLFLMISAAAGVAQQAPAETELQALSLRKNLWLSSVQTDSLRQLIHPRCLYIHSNGWIQTADEVVADMQSGKLRYASVEVVNITTRCFPKTGVVTGTGIFKGTLQDKPFSFKLAFTEVYIRQGKKWQLVSRQAARLE